MAKGKDKSGRLSVFKGHEARLSKTIFHILALQSPLTIYDIHKEVKKNRGLRHTRYANVNKRVRALEDSGYIKKIGIKKTKAGFQASTYDLAAKAYLALVLNSISTERLLNRVDEEAAESILGLIWYTMKN